MPSADSHRKGNVFAAALGAIGGALVAVVATKAIPKIMVRIMSEMMRNMRTAMESGGMRDMMEKMGGG